MRIRRPEPVPEEEMLDWAAIVKAASTGFTLLLAAEAAALLLGLIGLPPGLLLTMLAAAVYAFTGRRAATGQDKAWLHGLAASTIAYGITIPLRLITRAIVSPWFVVVGIVFAAVVGAVAGHIQAGAEAAEAETTDEA